jgi:hypothetical protein
MIDREKLKAVKTIIVHDNCADGLMSAILLKDAYSQVGLHPEIRFVQYGTEAYKALKPEPNTLFCDFSPFIPDVEVEASGAKRKVPDPEKLQPWVESGTLILDHHKGAKAAVTSFGDNGVFGDEQTNPGVSGAVLAFQEVWQPFYNYALSENMREVSTEDMDNVWASDRIDKESERSFAFDLAAVAGIRDTWMNKHPRWREACVLNEVLKFYPNEDWLEMSLPFRPGNRGFWTERLKLGNLLWTKHEKGIQKCIERAWRFTSAKGTRVVVFEGVRSSSDVAEMIAKEADLIMGFDYQAETPKDGGPTTQQIIYSTRSHTNFNCMEFAKRFGGGGHTRAAGFNIDFHREVFNREASSPAFHHATIAAALNPYSLAEILVQMHEKGT